MQTYRSHSCLRALLLLVLFSTSWVQLKAQFASFLTYDFTPNELSLGGAFTALPTNSVYAAWYNPAQLGFKTDYSVSMNIAPKSDWIFGSNISNLGLRYQQSISLFGKEIEIGVSLHQFLISYGTIDITTYDNPDGGIGAYELFERSQSVHIGLGTKILSGIYISLGYSLKNAGMGSDNTSSNNADAPKDWFDNSFANDVGIMTQFNMVELLNSLKSDDLASYQFTIGLGYALKNLGAIKETIIEGSIEDNIWASPLPRTSQLGISISMVNPYQLKNGTWINIISVDLSREARDLLLINKSDVLKYQSVSSSDISLFDNFVKRKINNNSITIHDGARFTLLESLQISYGVLTYKFFDSENDQVQSQTSWGISFDLSGLKKYYLDKAFPFFKPISLQISSSTSDHYFGEFSIWGIQLEYTF